LLHAAKVDRQAPILTVQYMFFKRVHIFGVGLIGGSFALALKRAGLAGHIAGSDSEKTLEKALTAGIIDEPCKLDSVRALDNSDLVYLAAPVRAIIHFLETDAKFIKPGALITDAGSTKREVCRAAREGVPQGAGFVAGHPMAGSHNSGVEYARADLFEGASYAVVIEPQPGESNSGASRTLIDVVKAIGGVPVLTTAEEHDRVVARSSHAPQLLSTALALAVSKRGGDMARLSGRGFLEMTRLAMSEWSVWEDICRTNADEIAAALAEVIGETESLVDRLKGGDLAGIGDRFNLARRFAEQLHRPGRSKGQQ
jgi:prephenate dehydrogenase